MQQRETLPLVLFRRSVSNSLVFLSIASRCGKYTLIGGSFLWLNFEGFSLNFLVNLKNSSTDNNTVLERSAARLAVDLTVALMPSHGPLPCPLAENVQDAMIPKSSW